MEDVDLNLDDFVARVNSDLVGKYVNIASRAAGFLHKHFDGKVCDLKLGTVGGRNLNEREPYYDEIVEKGRNLAETIAQFYENLEFGFVVRSAMEFADDVNRWWDKNEPWKLAKNFSSPQHPSDNAYLHRVCSVVIEWFRQITLFVKPVLPHLAREAEKFLNIGPLEWGNAMDLLPAGHKIGTYSHLMTRIDPKAVAAMVEASKESLKPAKDSHSRQRHAEHQQHTDEKAMNEPDHINIDDFAKVDLRIARIVNAEHVEGADKLLKLTLDIGEERPRQVFAGIKSAYDPEKLVGRLTVMVANLAPRKMKFGLSEGMVLAASGEGPGIFILSPDQGALPGMRVK